VAQGRAAVASETTAPAHRRLATRPLPPRAANHVWAYDFGFDACANGQQIKCLAIVDEFTHECLAINVAGSIRSRRVIDVLARLISLHGAPAYLRSDSGPEFVSQAVLKWLTDSCIDTAVIDPESLGRMERTNRSTANCATSV
jgi:putative transposase